MAALAKQVQFEEVKRLLKEVCNIELAGDSTPETLPRDLLTAVKTLGVLKAKEDKRRADRRARLDDDDDHNEDGVMNDPDVQDEVEEDERRKRSQGASQFSVADTRDVPADVQHRRKQLAEKAAMRGFTPEEAAAAQRTVDAQAEVVGMSQLRRKDAPRAGRVSPLALAGLDQLKD